MNDLHRRRVLLGATIVALFLFAPGGSFAAHESTNSLVCAPVAGAASSTATGDGVIEFRGGSEPASRWTAMFQFGGLEPGETFSVVVQGRFGEDGSPETQSYTEICGFRANAAGAGDCWYYFVGLKRLGIVQLRSGSEAGPAELQATRAPGGLGTITSVPNQHSPSPTPAPVVSPVASPVAAPG